MTEYNNFFNIQYNVTLDLNTSRAIGGYVCQAFSFFSTYDGYIRPPENVLVL